MPDQDEILATKQAAERDLLVAESLAAANRERALAAIKAARLKSIIENPDVQWFLETCVDPLIVAEHRLTHDLKRTAGEADISRHRYAMGLQIRTLLQVEYDLAAAKAAAPAEG